MTCATTILDGLTKITDGPFTLPGMPVGVIHVPYIGWCTWPMIKRLEYWTELRLRDADGIRGVIRDLNHA